MPEVEVIRQQLCSKCKRILDLTSDNFYNSQKRSSGFSHMCIQCYKRKYETRSKKVPDRTKLTNYKFRDLKRGQSFEIDMEFLKELLTQPCTYCSFPSTGLDRLDNKIGHTKENCVPCCKECNVARMNHFTHEEMLILGQTIKLIKEQRTKVNQVS